MELSIKQLFKPNLTTSHTVNNATPPAMQPARDNIQRQENETYQHWGKRICGNVSGNILTLIPFLQNVYQYIYNKQAKDEFFQEQRKQQIRTEITICNNNIEHNTQQINDHLQKIEDNRNRISKLEDEKKELQVNGRKISGPAKAKLVIGLVILIPLTFYLFLFYSSTFFSAFLDNGHIKSAAGAMFNAKAFSEAWATSIPEFFLMLSFPVIFLGLGFGLHFFSMEKSRLKYLKMAAIVFVTFAFDSILAYKIGERIYNWQVLNGVIPDGVPYSISLAIKDVSSWAVIFCGFIAYIIWGIVFDQSMDAYGGLNQNQIELDAIKEKIEDVRKENEKENSLIQSLRADNNKIKNEIAAKESQLGNTVFIDKNEIKIGMTDFFAGWIATMEFLGCSKELQEKAQESYNNVMKDYQLMNGGTE